MKRKTFPSRVQGFSLIELLVVVTIAGVLLTMTIPVFSSIMRSLRADGDMRSLAGDVTLAKMRAAASFSKSRVLINLSARTFQLQVWDKTTVPSAPTWSTEGGTQNLSPTVTFGYASLTTPPANTQTAIGEAANCQTDAQTIASTAGTDANLRCIVFSSRGIPVDNTGIPTAEGAFYVNNGNAVHAITVTAPGLIRTWRTDSGAANWKKR